MSYLLIHNGNPRVKSWFGEHATATVLPCVGDVWQIDSNLIDHMEDKIEYLTSGNFCTDCMASETGVDLAFFKGKLPIVKILTSYERDRQNLDPAWCNGYDRKQWLINCVFGLWAADQLVYFDDIGQDADSTLADAIVFSPGRSGTHLTKGLLGIANHLHHDNDLLISPRFQHLLRHQNIVAVMRKNFHDQATSQFISECFETLVTYPFNLSQNRQKINTWSASHYTESHARQTWTSITNYVDLLLALRIVYNKRISFYLMENFQPYYHKAITVKNPYQKSQLISNYEQSADICKIYQPLYEQCLDTVIKQVGLSIYKT